MIDTGAKKATKPVFEKFALVFQKKGITPIRLTVSALIIGVSASVIFYFGHRSPPLRVLSVALLWLSGLLDAVDGTLARMTNSTSNLGALLDVTFDRVVEVAIFLSVALVYEEARLAVVWNACMVILSMTVFLLTASFKDNDTDKSFYYQTGIMERTEGFIAFSLAWLFPVYAKAIYTICGFLILLTAIQRFNQAIRFLKEK